ncbi:MAG: sigma-54-dependent Fis family transcriptional regulator [Betaproteobacteria bacterium HGW-Betaproteobacteria-1]|jgi:transcriptional regulator of acetoin/glycerol metabolism|nr:MAG: sigma-54-dependent Fis family transcriptional regulator [Betaproteobacteria bacterium HGW-Betaproteobacteria-1]
MSRSNYLHQIRNAREQLQDRGELPDGLLPEPIQRSWERCIETGLAVNLRPETEPAATHQLNELRERNSRLLTQAQPEMESLYSHIANTQSMVILSDADGTIIHAMGDQDFMSKAQRVALQPGVSWREDISGTNAIGTALIEKNPIFVMGGEHYFEENAFLNCSASPILDPHGSVIGVLDLSGDHRQPQEHTMALVRMSALMIENRLFNAGFATDVTIRFHTRPEFIGTLWEGIAVFSPDGKLLAINRTGAFQLGLDEQKISGIEFDSLFEVNLAKFLDVARRSLSSKSMLVLKNGLRLHAKADPGMHTLATAISMPSNGQDRYQPTVEQLQAVEMPLDRLDTGDSMLRKTLTRASKALGHDIPVLIEGETGTGKELLAKAIHESGQRKHGAFVAINCASIPEGLIESELFGHEEGAFTGARRRGAVGRIQQAHGGTLFLDEVGEMPLALQARLLRVIQEREIVPLGSNKRIEVDISIIAATNQRLRTRVQQGEFREDLYYRLNGLRLTLPPLRERSDLQALIQRILEENLGRNDVVIQPEVLDLLQRHPWRGNVRQLFNVLRSALVFMEDHELGIQHLPEDFFEELDDGSPVPQVSAMEMNEASLPDTEAALIRRVLAAHHGNMTAAARQLGISRATIYRKSKRLNLV